MENTLAVLSCTGQSISFFDLTSNTRKGYLGGLPAEPHELCLDKKRNVLYASHTYRDGMYGLYSSYSREISIIDLVTMKFMDIIDVTPAEAPHDFAIDTQHDILWVTVEKISAADGLGGGLIAIDLKTHKVTKRIECLFEVHWFVMTPDGKRAYTCNKTAPFISILDLEEARMIGKIDVPGGTEQPDLSSCGQYLLFPTPSLRFGTLPSDPAVLAIDLTTEHIVKTVPLEKGYGPASVHVAPTGVVMVAQYRFDEAKRIPINGKVSVFDAKLETLLGEVESGIMPLTMRASSDGRLGFVAAAKGGTIDVIDLEHVKKLRTIDVDVVAKKENKFQTTAHGMALF
ncbi:hypothetical protein LTS17_010132 [Exophiala oligosperma]